MIESVRAALRRVLADDAVIVALRRREASRNRRSVGRVALARRGPGWSRHMERDTEPTINPTAGAARQLCRLFVDTIGLIELRLRHLQTRHWSQEFIPTRNAQAAARLAERRAETHDVYVGALPRRVRRGRREDLVPQARVAWVDLDHPAEHDSLRSFPIVPSLVVASGTPGHRHVYWCLDTAIPIDELEAINRTLAARLNGDPSATDGARILRVAGTYNHKRTLATPVRLLAVSDQPVELAALRQALDLPTTPRAHTEPSGYPGDGSRDAPRTRPAIPPTSTRVARLLMIPPAEYVAALTGQPVPDGSRKVRCPLHDDHTPSLHVYETAGEGWWCFGCRRGGSVYDLAAAMTRRPLRGPGFRDLQRDLITLLIEHHP